MEPDPDAEDSRRRSLREWYADQRHFAIGQMRAAQAARARSEWVDTGFCIFERDVDVAGSLLAGALAYRLFLWLLPAALVAVGGLGFASSSQVDDASNGAGVSGVVADGVSEAAVQAHTSRWYLLVGGLVLLWFASRHLLKALRITTRLAYRTGGAREKVSPMAVLTLLGACLAAAVIHTVSVAVRRHGLVLSIGTLIFMTVIWAAAWWGVSWLLPHGGSPAVYLVPGAALVGVGIQGMYVATTLYFGTKITHASHLYGALGTAATLLLWLFIMARMVIASAEIGAVLWERRSLDPWIRRFHSVLQWLHLA